MNIERICIVGLGLIGGSFALALRLAQRTTNPHFSLHMTIVDTNPDTRVAAERLADVVTDDFAMGVQDADLIVLATPVRVILSLLAQLPEIRPDGCMVMDLGSSKADICRMMDQLPDSFATIGGHPMAGKETAGFGAATVDMFRKQTFILCHTKRTTSAIEQIGLDLIGFVGAVPLFIPPELHDEMVASISHLPYLVAASLMRTADGMADDRLWPVSASGFRDTSRVSGTNPKMMLDILMTNREMVLQQVEDYQARLTAVTELLQSQDETALLAWLTETQQAYRNYRAHKE